MLKSKGIKPITYVGYTNNLKKRINLHNSGKGAKFTRGSKWVLLYKEKSKTRSGAMKREAQLKKDKMFRSDLRKKLA